jgi:hypothetical protein
MRSGSAEKTYASGQGGGVGGPVAGVAVVRCGASGGPRGDGCVLNIAGVAVGEDATNGESCAGKGGANGESCAGEGGANGDSCASDGGVGDGAGGGVGGSGVRAGEGGVVLRGERKRASSSPPSLSSSSSHRLLAAFLVRLAGGGEGFEERTGECSGRRGTGQCEFGYCLFSSAVGDFTRDGVGEEAGGARAAGARAAGTRICDGGADSVDDRHVARRWRSVMPEGDVKVLVLGSQSSFVFRRRLGACWRHNVHIGERTLLSVKQGGCQSSSRL